MNVLKDGNRRERIAVRQKREAGAVSLPKSLSRVDETYDRLLSLAHRLGPHAKMPTVRALREEMNVSQATLDAALSRLEGQQVVVRRQGSGVYVSSRLRLRNIVLLCSPDQSFLYGSSPFWRLLIQHIRDLAERNEAHLSLHFLRPHTPAELIQPQDPSSLSPGLQEEITTGAIHGVITVGVLHSVARWIEGQGVPVVAYAGAADYIIGQSHTNLVQMGVAALARQGCQRIDPWFATLNVSGVSESESHNLYSVYRGAMLANGLTPSPPIDASQISAEMENEASAYYNLALHQYGKYQPTLNPDLGLVSSDDMKTQGVLMAMYRLGLRPGRDIKIATHSNAGSTALLAWHPEITRLEYDPAEIVRLLFETLDALMNNETPHWSAQAIRTPEWTYSMEPTLILPEGV